ncbi:unnamed protein product [Gongylonema pulchrum]|uniref:Serine/threonine-protein phosphatase n=1 Tax=Gongylonema pulchrum TaxID=637853 RepID=A0A183E4B6_9BILA|nr:unnamed protein product [Gongylonema pulchrum]
MAVIGDLHADFTDLMKSLNNTGWPTERTLIFLGDYIDRGDHPIEVLLLLFLLKLRYRKRVVLLRGNHETYEQCALYGLIDHLEGAYPEEDKHVLFFTLNNVFDHLPLAAIISDQILCCHGGVSQFANSRSEIASIQRPPRWMEPTTTLYQIAILTDILWSDPGSQE